MTSCTSPRPSAMILPISVVTVRARSSFFRRKIRAASGSSSPRRGAGVFFHFSKASFAWRTAWLSSSFVASGKVARISPVAGLRVSKRFPSDCRHLPPMKRPYSWTIVFAEGCKVRRGYHVIVGSVRDLRAASTTGSSPYRQNARAPSKRLAATTSGDHGRTSAANRFRHSSGPTPAVPQPNAVDRAREESELVRRPHVPGPSAVDYAVSIEEDGGLVRSGRMRIGAVTLHLQRRPCLVRLKEEVDEGPFRERVSGESQRFVHGEPRGVFNLVRFQPERLGDEMAFVHEPERVRGLAREPGDVDVQEPVEDDVHTDLLFRLAFHADLGALPVVHESARDVPVAFRETADRLDHQDAQPLRQDDLGDASDHCRVDGTLHERVDIAPLENRVSAPPLLRMVIEPRLVP